MSKGYVYVLSNPSMPGIVKIGKSERGARKRADELYQTGVPSRFVVEFEVLTWEHDWVERETHRLLSGNRVSDGREFFSVDPQEASITILKCVAAACDMEMSFPDLIVRTDDLQDLAVRSGVDSSYPGMSALAQAVALLSPEEVQSILWRWEENMRARINRGANG